jgi:GAF domain-containing protein
MMPSQFEASLADIAAVLAKPGQPHAVYAALDRQLGTLIGHKLFTLMVFDERARTVERVYSNQPAAYPAGGKKPYSASSVFDRLLRDHLPYIARSAADIEAAFTDHALIASLGCAASLNLPVVYDGRPLGLMNLLGEAGRYDEAHATLAAPFAALLAAPFQQALRGKS